VPVILGAIIGNPYCKEDPDKRPPAGAQVGLFTDPLISTAKGQGWPLVTTRQLFDLVCLFVAATTEQQRDKVRADARQLLGI